VSDTWFTCSEGPISALGPIRNHRRFVEWGLRALVFRMLVCGTIGFEPSSLPSIAFRKISAARFVGVFGSETGHCFQGSALFGFYRSTAIVPLIAAYQGRQERRCRSPKSLLILDGARGTSIGFFSRPLASTLPSAHSQPSGINIALASSAPW